jgi:ribose transport system substrate-binding protein
MARRYIPLGFALTAMLAVAGCASVSNNDGGTAASTSAASTNAASTTAAAAAKPNGCGGRNAITEKDWNSGRIQLPALGADAGRGKKIAYIGFGLNNPWSGAAPGLGEFTGIKCEAEAHGATANFIGPPSFDAHKQSQMVEDLAVSKKYDALVITPDDSVSIAPALKKLIAAGIPVVSTLQPAGPNVLSMSNQIPGLTGNVIEDLTVNAQTMADGVIQACKAHDPCKVIVIWGARSLAFDKVKPPIFFKRIAGHPNIKIVCQEDGGYDRNLGLKAAQNCLHANPGVNVLASQTDTMARGAEVALKAAGKTIGLGNNDVVIVSAYGNQYGVAQVRASRWLQTSYNRNQSMGAAATRMLLLKLAGKTVPEASQFIVQDRDLDNVPNRLTREVLEAHPNVLGQWQG